MKLESIQVGRKQVLMMGAARPWSSGIVKRPVEGSVRVGRENLEGDEQAHRDIHGGPDRPILAYGAEHYPLWREELGKPDLPYGAFGENFTIAGQNEDGVCLGDVYEIGGVRVEVSQPREPCIQLARRWQIPDLPKRVLQTCRGGWYMRVLREGCVEAGAAVELTARPNPEWTIRRALETYHASRRRPDALAELGGLAALSEHWKRSIRAALEGEA